jgi:hypothetical protein
MLQLECRDKAEPRFKMILDTNPVQSGDRTVLNAEFEVLGYGKSSSQDPQSIETRKDYLSELKCQFNPPPVVHSTAPLNALKSSAIASTSSAGNLFNAEENK